MNIDQVAFIGLGVMGYPMAGHLAQKGYAVTVHNRTLDKAEAWRDDYGGTVAGSPAEAAAGKQVVLLCVGDDDDLRDVVFAEDGVLSTMQPGAILVDHTTASASIAKEIHAQAAAKDIAFLDAPVSGGGSGATNGTLSIMVGGSQEHFDQILPLLQSYGKTINLMGACGSGQLTKMVNQICIAATLQGVAEAIRLGTDSGLDMAQVLGVIAGGAAQSWQLENRGPWMLDARYKEGGFTVDLIKKDLALCIDHAAQTDTTIPVTSLVNGFFAELQQQGKGEWDFSSLFELLSDSR